MHTKLKLLIPLLVLTISSCGDINPPFSSDGSNNSTIESVSIDSLTNDSVISDSISSDTLSSISTDSLTSDSISSESVLSDTTSSSSTDSSSSSSSESETHYIEGNYEYFIQTDSSATREFMKTPYVANVTSTAPSNYYTSVSGLSGNSLLNGLKSVISGPSTSYDWSRFEYVDENPHATNSVFCIYVRDSYKKSDHVSGNSALKWNREHTYPQSKLSGNAKSDSQLIFPDDWKTNGIRSNNKYGVVTHSTSTAVRDSGNRVTANYSSGSIFEPCDAAKGEVARATLYTYVLYGEPITDNFTSLELCLSWHEQFPPTTWEMYRNNRNYTKQGNRNPFIDHPEYARMMF